MSIKPVEVVRLSGRIHPWNYEVLIGRRPEAIKNLITHTFFIKWIQLLQCIPGLQHRLLVT